ncbi:MAG: hypothetical protein ACKVX7_01310 [Planctomycetota bacterium]
MALAPLLVLVTCWPAAMARDPQTTAPPRPATSPALGLIDPAVESFARQRFATAEEHYRLGRYQNAYKLADALLVLMPDISFREEVRRLRRSAEGRFLGLSVLSVRFELPAGATLACPVTALEGQVVVENISMQLMRIKVGAETTVGQLHYRLTEFFVDGSRWFGEERRAVKLARDVTLAPDEKRTEAMRLDLPPGKQEPVLQIIEINGSFRPRELKVGDELITRTIPWQTLKLQILPSHLEFVRADPRAELWKSLTERVAPSLIAAGYLWLSELEERGALADVEREAAVDLLLATLRSSTSESYFDTIVIRLLESYTGVETIPTRDAWLDWATRRGKRPGG